jgi:hypothetical protein
MISSTFNLSMPLGCRLQMMERKRLFAEMSGNSLIKNIANDGVSKHLERASAFAVMWMFRIARPAEHFSDSPHDEGRATYH